MGIFSFLKSAGQRLIPGKDDAPPKTSGLSEQEVADLTFGNRLARFAMELGVPVEGLKVRFKDGTATVEGRAESQAHRENVIIAIGNTEGVSHVEDRRTLTRSTRVRCSASPKRARSRGGSCSPVKGVAALPRAYGHAPGGGPTEPEARHLAAYLYTLR
ncbi:MAG: BON domain-containing protein [Gemmatimonadota bacterium]